jgi:hypothetical protein
MRYNEARSIRGRVYRHRDLLQIQDGWSAATGETSSVVGKLRYYKPKLQSHQGENSRVCLRINEQEFLATANETGMAGVDSLLVPLAQRYRCSSSLHRPASIIVHKYVQLKLDRFQHTIRYDNLIPTKLDVATTQSIRFDSSKAKRKF